jgi:PKHD-type hydroxylase
MENDNIIRNQNLVRRLKLDNIFTPEECKNIIRICDDFPLNEATLEGEIITKSIRETKVRHLRLTPETRWIWDKVFHITIHANKNYYKFNIIGISELQLLEYQPGCFYDWHVDITAQPESCTRKLSIIAFLSDPADYDGGQITWDLVPGHGQKPLPLEQGSMVIFPSFQAHKVEPVTRGNRFTLVGWFHGNSFS